MPKQIVVDLNAKLFPGASGLYLLVEDDEVEYEVLETSNLWAVIDAPPGVYQIRAGVDAPDRPRGTLSGAVEIEVLSDAVVIPPKPDPEPTVKPAFPAPAISVSIRDASEPGLKLVAKKPPAPVEPTTGAESAAIFKPGPNGLDISLSPAGVFFDRDPSTYEGDKRFHFTNIAGPRGMTPSAGGDFFVNPVDYRGEVHCVVNLTPSGRSFDYFGKIE